MFSDSSAAKGILTRTGAGPVKHLSVKQLWVQEKVSKREVNVTKIPRAINTADACTHAWQKNDEKHFLNGNVRFQSSSGWCSKQPWEGEGGNEIGK